MKHEYFNPNPYLTNAGDCVVRMLCKITNQPWEVCYDELANKGKSIGEMPSSNLVWMSLLKDLGFTKYVIPDTCPDCYTIKDFCYDHPVGTFVVATGSHVVAIEDGTVFDSWNSLDKIPIFYFAKEI